MTIGWTVTEVVTATRCARQLVLVREGHRVVPFGDGIGGAAHAVLASLVESARRDPRVLAQLSSPLPDRDALSAAIYRAAFRETLKQARRIAPLVDGADLGRLDRIARDMAALLAQLVARARAHTQSGAKALDRAIVATERDVTIALGDVSIRGRVDLLCHDANTGETWLWDLKTYAGTDLAQNEQVRLYALAYANENVETRPALLHMAHDRIEHAPVPKLTDDDVQKLRVFLGHMQSWADGSRPPPPALDRATCRTCPAQRTCWTRWGRTLPDELDSLHTPSSPPATVLPAGPMVSGGPRNGSGALDRPGSPGGPEPLWIGMLDDKSFACVPASELTRHVAVFGASGAGKTYFAKAIVEEAALAGIPVLAFDVQGDLAQLAQIEEDGPAELRARREAYRDRVEVRLLTPGTNAGLRLSLNPLRLPTRSMDEDQRTLYVEAVAENLLDSVNVPPRMRPHARSYLATRLVSAMDGPARALSIEDLVGSIVRDEDVDDPLLDRKERAALVKQLRLLTTGSQRLLFERGRPLDIDALLLPATPGKTPLNILWLNGLADQTMKERFVTMVLADIYGWMLRQRGGAPRLLLFFDEVGPYMPPTREPAPKKLLKRIFKEGRKYGVCGLFCTQNFTDVDYKVVAQANTVAIGRINTPQDKKKAREILEMTSGFDAAGVANGLGGVPQGRYMLRRVEGSPQWVQGRRLVTYHRGTWGEDEIRAHTTASARAAWEATVPEMRSEVPR